MCDYLQFESIFDPFKTNATFQSVIYVFNNINNDSKYKYEIATQNASKSIELIQNKPPNNGRCIANKNEGQALKDRFNITCNSYNDIETQQQAGNNLIKYYFISYDNTIIKQSENGKYSIMYGKSGIQYLQAVIMDSNGGYICKTLKFNILKNTDISQILNASDAGIKDISDALTDALQVDSGNNNTCNDCQNIQEYANNALNNMLQGLGNISNSSDNTVLSESLVTIGSLINIQSTINQKNTDYITLNSGERSEELIDAFVLLLDEFTNNAAFSGGTATPMDDSVAETVVKSLDSLM